MKNTKINTKPLSGFMELKPEEQIQFNRMMKIVQDTYELYGFVPLDTPILERAEVLLAKGGDDTDKQIYRFQKGDTDLAMRFDLTVPLARYVAEYQESLTFPFRRYAIGKVYRGEKPQAGRFREFYQCDIDIIGKNNLDVSFDAEIPLIISTLIKKLGFEKFTIKINNRKILNGFFESLNITDNLPEVLKTIDKIQKVGQVCTNKELLDIGISKENIKKIFDFIDIKESVIEKLEALNIQNPVFKDGFDELKQVMSLLDASGIDKKNYKIDLTIARGLDYYTGTVYETVLDDYPDVGSVCGGGRYDNLTSYYTSNTYQGVGITFGLTRFFYIFNKNGYIDTSKKSNTKILILGNENTKEYAFNIAERFRLKGIRSEILYNFRDGLSYANRLGIPYVVFIGEDEMKKGIFKLKDMNTREQDDMSFEEILEKI